MGDTMREAFEEEAARWIDPARAAEHLSKDDNGDYYEWGVLLAWECYRAAHEAGRQLGMEQARREQAQWQQPGPVTPEHPLDCLIVLQSLRQSDGDWWIAGSTFLSEYQPVAWLPDTPEVRQALGIPTPPAGDSDTGSAA